MELVKTMSINNTPHSFVFLHTQTRARRRRRRRRKKRKRASPTSIHPTIKIMVKNNKVGSLQANVVGEKEQENLHKSMASRKKQYKGVRMRSWGSWVSEIRAPNQKTRIWLGSYSTPEAAARAYDAALLCLKGSSANLNFPITPSTFIPTTLMSPKSIQRIAAAAANATTPSSSTSPSPPTPSTSSPSPSPSPSPSSSSSPPSSPLDYQDELFTSSWADYTACEVEEPLHSTDQWYDFGESFSPKYMDEMINACTFLAPPPLLEECDEEGDIHLWSFC